MDTTRSGNSTVEADVYIRDIFEKATHFMRSDIVWNRDELKNAISSIIDEGEGVFCCLLGGKSTGKSLVLSKLIKQNTTRSIVYVNLRLTKGILYGLIESLKRDSFSIFAAARKALSKLLSLNIPLGPALTARSSLSDFAEYIADDKELKDVVKLKSLLEKVAKKGKPNAAGCGLTVIIDEANEAFTQSPDKEAAHEALTVFTALTKEQRKVSEPICKYLLNTSILLHIIAYVCMYTFRLT